MSERASRLERFLERALDAGAGAGLHPAELLQRVHTAAESSVRDGAIANVYTIALEPAAAKAFMPHAESLSASIERMLDDLAKSRGLRRLAPWSVRFARAPRSNPESVQVTAEYRTARTGTAVAAGATRALRRLRGVFLEVEGAGRVALTHTPFTIGRSRECDLALFDLAVSRRHAVIDGSLEEGLVVRDLGSRNGIESAKGAVAELSVVSGDSFVLGGTRVTLEVADER